MDWRDLSRTDADLLELARVATRRELREECALDEDEILATQLLGFALLLHRGGKPEFLAVCSLGTTADRISLRRRERGLIERHEAAPVDLTGPHAFADSLAAISATHPGRFAVQWGLCVEAVRDHLDDGTIDRFLAEHRQRLL